MINKIKKYSKWISVAIIIPALLVFLGFTIPITTPEGNKSIYVAIKDDINQRIELIRKIYNGENPRKKDYMMSDIQTKLLGNYNETSVNEINKLGYKLVAPVYLPERFINYGIYMQDNMPNQKIIRQVWYDPIKLEVLQVSQINTSNPDKEDGMIFTASTEDSGKISDSFSWARYRCQNQYVRNGIFFQGYMLVNNESNKYEYEQIIGSLK